MKSLKLYKIIFFFGVFWYMFAVKSQSYLYAEYYYVDDNGFVHWGHVDEPVEEVEPIDDEEMNAFYLAQAAMAQKNLEEEKGKDSSIVSPGSGLGSEVTQAQGAVAAGKEASDKAAENQDLKTEQNQQASQENLEQKELPVDGDPVKHSLGSYEQDETDISNGRIEVKRSYSSQNYKTSSMGYGWVTDLDQRIILGTLSGAEQRLQAMENYVEELTSLVSILENAIQSVYGVGSLDGAVSSLESRKENAFSNIRSADNLYYLVVGLEMGSRPYEAHAVITSLKTAAATHMQNVINKYNHIASSISQLENDIGVYNNYRTLLLDAQTKLQEYNSLVSKSEARKIKNRYVMFEGMDLSYEETGLDTLTVIDEAGYPHLLTETSDGSEVWICKGDTLIEECTLSGQGYKVIQYDGIIKDFDANGFLIKVTDRNSNSVSITRGNDGKITAISDSFGEGYTVSYKGKYIGSIVNKRTSEECVVYGYEGNKLTLVTDTDGDTVTMKYDSGGRLTHLYKCDNSFVEFVYGQVTNDGCVLATATKNEEDFEETFDYYPAENKTVYTDHDGNQTVYIYDENHRTKEEHRPDNTVIINGYDTDGNLVSVKENGNTTTYRYDKRGNRTAANYSDGSSESWVYDKYNQVQEYTDRDGLVTSYGIDEKGNIVSCSIGGETVYTLCVNQHGQVEWRTVHGQQNVTTTYKYDDFGNLEYELCGGIKTEYEYDKRNRVTKVTIADKVISEYEYQGHSVIRRDYNGLETTYVTNGRKDMTQVIQKDRVTGIVHKTRIEYDKRHLPLRIYTGDDNTQTLVLSYVYTPEGKLRTQINHGAECWVTLYEYQDGQVYKIQQFKTDTVDEPLQVNENVSCQTYNSNFLSDNKKRLTVTDALGFELIFEYDSFGNLRKTTDANNIVRQMSYTPAGRLNGEQSSHGGWYKYVYQNGNVTQAGEEGGEFTKSAYYPDSSIKYTTDRYNKTTYYNYDNMGRVSSIQGEVQKVLYEYDSLGRITKQITGSTPDEYGAIYYVTYDYSQDGRTVTVTEGGKYKTINQLDAFGNVISQTDGNGNTRRFEYDCQNQMTASYDGYDNKTSYEYNALGKVCRVVQPDGAQTQYYYNYLGLLEKVTDACGTVYCAVYDKAGRLLQERSRADSEKSYRYDNGGRLLSVSCGGEIIESYDYGADNHTVTVTDGNGEAYIYSYDDFGRLTAEYNRNGLVQSYTYDAEGQNDGQTGFDGSTTVITFSQDRTVRTVHYSDGSENRFEYDAMGNIIRASNAYGSSVYNYDAGGRLVYQKDVTTDEEIYFEYDQAGNRTRLYSTNRETIYTYGKNNEVKEIFDNKQRVRVQLGYNINGLEVLRKYANGTREETLYDRAGRVIVKVQKSERGELLWGEGYVYGEDGKRTATVDNAGRVTLYEYNKKGQLSVVYYPYTQEHLQKLTEEAETNGLPVTAQAGENKFLSSQIHSQLVPLLNSMQYGLASVLTNLQIFIKESYAYDGNGNRISKTTDFGKIEYSYDKENCLVSSGSRGQPYVIYTYDKAGNLLTQESAGKTTKYAYNSQNRVIFCEVTDKSAREYTQTLYAYDAMGRRLIVQDIDQSALRTLYDGFTFDVIKQSPVFANGLFTDSNETGIRWGASGKPTGERYRYLDDEYMNDSSRYIYLDDDTYRTTSSRYYGERTQISANGTLAAQASNGGSQYFITDLFGSVAAVCDSSGYQLAGYTYDAFGSLIQGSLSGSTDFGYLGKQQDPISRLYNYGYRDYQPESARFTTVDPVRDGSNWFAYVNNDPVNFVDLWGLELVLTVNKDTQIMTVELRANGIVDKREIKVTTAVVSHDPTKNTDTSRTQETGDKKTNPTQFPNGTYKITGTKTNPIPDSPNYGNQWITTAATQQLKATDGTIVEDGGYQIHLTNYSNTNGCIGIKYKADMNYLLMCVTMNESVDPGSSKIIVTGGEKNK
ncbi:MAG: RHS repeat-associated core domain-containing protein [Treponema sp.]|nr:RHS repeat-associated core domain-containing protein [Treponema sp.]